MATTVATTPTPRQPEAHGDRTQEARQHQADRQPKERGHPDDDTQFS